MSLSIVELASPAVSMQTSISPFYSSALNFPRHTAFSPIPDVEYAVSTPKSAPTVTLSQSDGIIWAGPGWIEFFTSESTVYTSSGILEGSSQVVEIEEVVNAAPSSFEAAGMGTTVEMRLSTTSNPKASQAMSSSKQNLVPIAQTEDNSLVLEGVGVIETLISSEISASVVTLTAFETIVLTTVSTSTICTCDDTLFPVLSSVLSPTSITSSQPTSAGVIGQSSTFDFNSTPTKSATQQFTFPSLSSISTSSISSSSATTSTSTSAILSAPALAITSDSASSTPTTTVDSQPSVTPFAPPGNLSCNARPPGKYTDVHEDDVANQVANFCQTNFPQDCSTNGYAFQEDGQIVYNMSVIPIPFCSNLSASTCENPIPDPAFDCSASLWTAWRNCYTNDGMGGNFSIGCLTYIFSPIAY